MKTRYGRARIEVIAARKEIAERLEAGEAARQIFEDLREAGRVTVSERAFYAQTLKLIPNGHTESRTGELAPIGQPAKPAGRSAPATSPITERARAVTKQPDTAGKPSSIISAEVKQLSEDEGSFENTWGGANETKDQ
ncbi:MAG: hypothetical protein CMM61_03490 [Rhodospirillaceae bacterium]|nr:hypothetical protein [Rhodospirillaceae bacterium]